MDIDMHLYQMIESIGSPESPESHPISNDSVIFAGIVCVYLESKSN